MARQGVRGCNEPCLVLNLGDDCANLTIRARGPRPLKYRRGKLARAIGVSVEQYEDLSVCARLTSGQLNGALELAFLEQSLSLYSDRARYFYLSMGKDHGGDATDKERERRDLAVAFNDSDDSCQNFSTQWPNSSSWFGSREVAAGSGRS